eukprot:TRINITY_DN646_c0_g1_i1.p1 TRINITY_DN646_c0_g1~~TRINITY_DN646_c0_g1_i1.p1  ORF type:complete len:358 (-),score=62.21 TRINITY_DN646_c0_g1_i1:76-1149(-)
MNLWKIGGNKYCLYIIFIAIIVQQIMLYRYIINTTDFEEVIDDYEFNYVPLLEFDTSSFSKCDNQFRVAVIITGQFGRLMELDSKMVFLVGPLLRDGYAVDLIFSLTNATTSYANKNLKETVDGPFKSIYNITDYLEDRYGDFLDHENFRVLYNTYKRPYRFQRNPLILKTYDNQGDGAYLVRMRFKSDMQQLFGMRVAYDYMVNEIELKSRFMYDYVIRMREDIAILGETDLNSYFLSNETDYATLGCNKNYGINNKMVVMKRKAAYSYMRLSYERMYADYPKRKRIRNLEIFLKYVMDKNGHKGIKLLYEDFPLTVVRNHNITGMCYHGNFKCPANRSMYSGYYQKNMCSKEFNR